MKNYRAAFWLVAGLAIALAAALAWSWTGGGRRFSWAPRAEGEGQNAVASAPTPSASAPATPSSASGAPTAAPALADLSLSPADRRALGFTTARARSEVVHDPLRAVGDVAEDERGVVYVQTRYTGWIEKVYADATYQYVRRGQPLFTIYSPAVAAAAREYRLARQNADALAASPVPGVAAGAGALLRAAAARLRQWQVTPAEADRLAAGGEAAPALTVASPADGFITFRGALPNQYVQPQTRLYTIADLSTVWVYADLFQDQLAGVAPGDAALVTVDSYPGRTFRGRVDFVYPSVDPATRTAKARIVLANPAYRLKPGMYVNVEIERPLGRRVVVPASAVLQTGTRAIVFVDQGDGYLSPRTVQLGQQVGDEFIVLSGLRPGETVAAAAEFLLDSDSQLTAALGSFAPPPPGASRQQLSAGPGDTLKLTFSPAPPRQGANALRAQLTDAQGAGVAGATVSAIFFMPAMPQMGMAAMRVPVLLSDQGRGLYTGVVTLPSSGEWQFTLVARRGGQTLAAQRGAVSVAGGGGDAGLGGAGAEHGASGGIGRVAGGLGGDAGPGGAGAAFGAGGGE